MKRSLVNIAMALCIGLFAACSQEEIISTPDNGVETVNIDAQLPTTVGTRALPGAEAGHQLRCILEVWDKAGSGTLITRIEKLASEASGDKLQFSFSVGKDVNYQCLLWADYIAANAPATAGENTTYTDKYFNTTNLKAIDFKVTDTGLFNNASADAFCGAVNKNGTISQLSVTLKRPFTKLTLRDNSADDYIEQCTSFGVTYNTPTGYNIATGETTTSKEVSATGLEPNDKTWFTTYIFASVSKEKLDSDIVMKVTKEGGEVDTKTIKKGQISLDANVENNAEANFSTDNDVNLDVDIDGGMEDPNALKIGQFVNKDGSVSSTYDAEKAIGIVFATGGKTDTSEYGEGKTVAGYAMGLTSTPRAYLGVSKDDKQPHPILTPNGDKPFEDNDYSGYAYTPAVVTSIITDLTNSALSKSYTSWMSENTHTASNLSTWYIPSGTQVKDFCGMIFGIKVDKVDGITGKNEAFATAYNKVVEVSGADYVIDRGQNGSAATWIMSSYVSSTVDPAAYSAMITNCANNAVTSVTTNTPKMAITNRYNIRPVLTIFK